jgi:putative ABC transport system permease protein
MMLRLLAASLRRRARQLLLMGLAVAVAAGTVAALTGFTQRVRGGLAEPFAAFGPNLVVRPQLGGPAVLPLAEVARVRAVPGVEVAAAVGRVEGAAAGGGRTAVVAASPEILRLHPTWRLTGRWPAAGEVLRGAAVPAAQLAGRAVAGTLTTGGELDRSLVVPLADLGPGGGVSRIEVRADRQRLAAVARAVEATVPGAEARPLARVADAERDLVRRLTLILALASLVACLLAVLSVGAAATALVEQRRVEVGLFLALGFTGRRVARLFAAELLIAAVVAGLAGELVGELAGGRLAGQVLATAGPAGPGWGLVTAPAAAVAVVGLAMLVALRRVETTDAARVLQGG